MRELNNTSLRESLEQLSTAQLDVMLKAELEKEPPDEYAVRLILKVLRAREADYPVETNEQVEAAWKAYEKKTSPRDSAIKAPLLKVAAALIVCGLLLFALPQEATAWGIFDRIAAWTDSIFELFSPDEGSSQKEYVFRTDHPGLQELYDTVTELGVTVPVVPMWIEEGYELADCKVSQSTRTTKLLATFVDDYKTATYELNIYSHDVTREYHKNQPDSTLYESNGITHNVFKNEEFWMVVWIRDNVECAVAIDCHEDVIFQILDSIYTMEE